MFTSNPLSLINGEPKRRLALRVLDTPVPLSDAPDRMPVFPLESLPPWLREHCVAVAAYLEVPEDFVGMLALACLSTALGGKMMAEPLPGWEEAIVLYVLIVAASAERKSPTFSAMFAPAYAWESETRKRVAADVAAASSERKAYEKALSSAENDLAKATTDDARKAAQQSVREINVYLTEHGEPNVPRVFIDDVSTEKLGEALDRFGGRLTLASPEAQGFFARAGGQYARGEASLDIFLKAHDAEPIRVDRMTRGSLCVDSPALSLALCAQPGVLRALGGKRGFRTTGLLARFLVAVPAPRVGSRTHQTDPVPSAVRMSYHHRVKALLDVPAPARGETLPVLHFTVDASIALRTFAQELEPRLAPSTGDLASIADWGGKLVGTTARIAALLHCADGDRIVTLGKLPWDDQVNADTVARAIRIARFLIAHAIRAFGAIDGGEDTDRAEYVLRKIVASGKGELSARDILRMARMVNAKELKPIIERLVDHGFLESTTDERRFLVCGTAGTTGTGAEK